MRPLAFRRVVLRLLSGVLVACATAVVLPLLSDIYWAFELPGHFRAQFAAVALLTTLALVVVRAWRHAVLGFILFAVIVGPVLMLWVPSRSSDESGSTLDVLSLNVSLYCRNAGVVGQLIQRLEPDIVGLVEVDCEWVKDLSSLDDAYPYRFVEPPGRRLAVDRNPDRPLPGFRWNYRSAVCHRRADGVRSPRDSCQTRVAT